nr:NB-ARC domains-containing protein [Tanacetum cinerariifolium]
MAEVIASTIIEAVFQKLANEAIKQAVRAKGIHSELKKLGRTLYRIQELLNDASNKEITNDAIQVWLNDLQHLAYDIDDILDDLATDAIHNELTDQSRATTSKIRKLIPACCTKFSLSTRMYPKLDNITNKLQDLEKEKESLGLMVKSGSLQVKDDRPKDKNRQSQTSLIDPSRIVGRQGDKDALVLKLLVDEPRNSENFSIVPIVGMGGVGKTTLAKSLYDDEKVKKYFKLKVWVCVSEEWDTFSMSYIIFQSVTGETKEFKDLNLLQVALRDQLRGKLFLLVLDDVWSESTDDWESLVAPLSACAPGSKIIMTTRKEKLLRQLGCGKLNHLQSLSHDDAMCLFAQHALGEDNFDSHPRLKLHGEGIVRKCNGLPLALKALGRLLRGKEEEVEWKELVESEIWSLKEEGKIIPALRLSYRELPANLKQLFAYCSLFPKDYAFDKEDLVLLWMAEGFLHQVSSSTSTKERFGQKCFDELLSRSFFQHSPNDESLFVIHDLMNDLATSVARDFCFRLEKELGKNVGKQALDKCRHISFVCEEYEAYMKFEEICRAEGLRTFLSVGVKERWQSNYLSNKVLVELLPKLKLLRVLSLSGYDISEVPESTGKLKHLRYLNLSQTHITHVPENVCDLYHLETLILFGCSRLTKFPNNFKNLKSLWHLDIRDTPLLKDLPVGVAKLKSLQTLSKIIIGGENDFSITQLVDFQNLHGKVSIEGLEKVKNATEAREANLSQKRLTEFEVKWSDASRITPMETTENAILDALKPYNDCLEKLGIVNYLCLEFPNWVGDSSFRQLTRVSIRGCKKCTSLPPLGQLQSLKELSIQDMGDVKVVGSEFFGTGLAFPSLESLSFRKMSGWEVWSTNGRSGVGDSVFPCLKELNIEDCPNLVAFSLEGDEVFPCLEEFNIEGCRNLVEVSLKVPLLSLRVLRINKCGDALLRSLVHVAPSVTRLKIEYIWGLTNEVWRGVILDLKAVEDLTLIQCDEIRYLWESKEAEAGSKILLNLRKLIVWECKNLVSLGDKDEEVGVGRRRREECVINTKTMPVLESVWISEYPNLALIIDFGGNFIHLTTLRIEDCKSTESLFGDLQLQTLTSLTNLEIVDCPSMDVPTDGLWPPNLRVLQIGQLKKPISEWGPQKFPTSLVNLTLYGRGEVATNWSELSHLHLPSSLTRLWIINFEKLESFSEGLQHLTSLQHLYINRCPKMKDLPQTLLPSLLSLYITGCPDLEKRCSKRGRSYWTLISHIPQIHLY